MPKFALRFPYFILMLCLVVALVGAVTVVRMPVDLFPKIDMPVVVVATFYNGMPPQQIEADITNTFERFFTLAANVDHSESRSLTGVSLIKIYFKPGTDPNAALSNIANLAMADLRRLPPGTLPPVVLGMDASTQPVCLVTLKGQGLNETRLKDLAQFQVRNQISNVQGASVPQPYGGTYRQIQIYVDPLKLEARNLSLNDVVQVGEQLQPDSARRRRAHRLEGLQHLRQQPVPRRQVDERDAAEVGGQLVGAGGRRRQGRGLRRAAVQHRAHRRPALGLRAHLQAGRRQQHHHHRERHQGGDQEAGRYSRLAKTAVVFDQSVFVKLAISNVVKRSGHRPGAHRSHDSGFSGQPARHRCRAAGGSAFDAGLPADHQRHGRLHQHHDPGRPGAGLLAPDR